MSKLPSEASGGAERDLLFYSSVSCRSCGGSPSRYENIMFTGDILCAHCRDVLRKAITGLLAKRWPFV